ncbi:MAG TPA: aminotransferase class I/II-fold pyridoxal phosphate-dependent enzyme [Candidatus Limnocylindrales bacterium]|nr:aminotransferase class I/II-fold pyridoxal phosphate-dependent enzyme [Candidatus Limnocylindrales bacterium]
MRIPDFALERYFARWEFAVRHVLCASDVEPLSLAEVLALADGETEALWRDLRLGYTESPGHPLLRREIAALYERLDPDDVLVFAGAEEAIFCLLNVLVGPGDHVVCTWPGYQSLYEVARAAGAAVTLHALRAEDGWALDVARLLDAIRPDTRLVIVNAPHNPTGMHPDRAEWQTLVDACAARGIRLLADEVYRGLELDPADRLPGGADALPGAGVSLGVMSKSYALAGLRIGWLATRDRALLGRCAAFKDYTTICSAAPSEVLALIALRAGEAILDRSRAIVGANLALADAFFARQAERFEWVRPRAGSVAFPRLRAPGAQIERFAAELVDETGVLLLPGSVFGVPGEHFRLGLGRTDFGEALAKLEAFAERRLPG